LEKNSTSADDLRVSTASGSEQGFRKDLLMEPRSLPLAVLTRWMAAPALMVFEN